MIHFDAYNLSDDEEKRETSENRGSVAARPGQYLKLVASGEVDDTTLEALEDCVKRQRKRLASQSRDKFDVLVE